MRIFRALPAALALLISAGCDSVLSTTPQSTIPADQIIVDSKSALGALTGAYDGLQSGSYYGLDIQMLGDLPADNSTWVGTYQFLGNIENNQIAPDNPEITDMWTAIYDQINRDNVILARVPEVAAIDEDTRDEVMGEAYFLRALGYSNLVKFWGGVPMPLKPVQTADEAATYTRATVLDVYAQILKDLDSAAVMISNTSNTRRATKTAVEALRSRVLFYRASVAGANATADYQAALDAANAVLAGRDELTVPFADLFSPTGANTSEDIFRVSFTQAEYNDLGYYWLYDGRQEMMPTDDLYAAFDPADLRLPATIYNDDGDLDAVKWPTTAGTEHPHVIRLAELVLIKAEVLARQGKLAQAVAEYNKVRERAGLPDHVLGVDVTTQQDVLDEIIHQRRLEFAFEGDRWPDLVRLGLAGTVKSLDDPGYVLFPIPAREITTSNGSVTQNPGY
ncbi:MAG TPA: RagB/SusD family nutrient uptake outer membrane protein [Gemmatimonadaceae bacterium]|nr:RagB/SusD family nutrient uptake outer membrane protein [Gemmatimonadaceae bacterium]